MGSEVWDELGRLMGACELLHPVPRKGSATGRLFGGVDLAIVRGRALERVAAAASNATWGEIHSGGYVVGPHSWRRIQAALAELERLGEGGGR